MAKSVSQFTLLAYLTFVILGPHFSVLTCGASREELIGPEPH
jgi:hypothetical protein